MSSRTRLLAIAVLLGAVPTLPGAQTPAPASAWWKHVVWLSDDSLKGRSVGTDGYRQAAEYVAAQFSAAGLRPAGNSFLQPVPLTALTIDQNRSRVGVRGSGETFFDLTRQVAVNARGTCGATDAPAVFVGYGIHAPEVGHDDLAGQDLKGRVAVFFGNAPTHLTAAVVAHRQSTGERWRILRDRGAVGLVMIFNPAAPGADWDRTITTAQQPTYALARGEEFADRRLAATLHHDASRPLFDGSGYGLPELLELVKAGKTLPSFPLRTSIVADLHCAATPVPSENVVGLLEGRDPMLRHEYVVMTAHLDHVGEFGQGDDRIHNGAMDNASGVASLIDLAHRFRAAGFVPRRTLALVAVTAEERNLLGSYYFVRNPPLPAGARVVANINIDMFLPIIPMKSLIAFGMEESSLQRDVEAAAASVGIQAERDPIPGQNIFIRSDQYNFVRIGVPSVMLLTGANGDQDIWKTWERWMMERYHRPSDDATQPVNFVSAETFQQAVMTLVRRVTDAAAPPAWNAGSVFRTTPASAARGR